MKRDPPETLILVYSKRCGKIFYPHKQEDFELLKKVGTSVKYCAADFLPLLEAHASAKGIKIVRLDFEALEAKALSSLERKWPGKFQLLGKGKFSLTCPRDNEHFRMVKSVKQALQQFYQGHGQRVNYVLKRGTKTVTVVFHAEPGKGIFQPSDTR